MQIHSSEIRHAAARTRFSIDASTLIASWLAAPARRVAMAVPPFLPWFVLIGSAAIVASLLFVLGISLDRAAFPAAERIRILRRSGGILIGWFLLAIVLAAAGAWRGAADRAPTIQYALFVPV